MEKYQEKRVKPTKTQLNKLKSAAKNQIGTILRLNKKIFEDEKLSKAQMSKINQSGGSFGFWFGNLGEKALTDIAIPLARDNIPGLVSNLTSNPLN